MPKVLRVVVFQEAGAWMAQCLEHDLGAQADSVKGVIEELHRMLVLRIVVAADKGISPWDVPAPPGHYEALFTAGIPLGEFDCPHDLSQSPPTAYRIAA